MKKAKEKIKAALEGKKDKHDRKELATIKERLDAKNLEIAEITDTLKRVQADFMNYKNRSERDMSSFRAYADESILKKLLPVLDSFEIALNHKDSGSPDEFAKGMEMIYAQFKDMLTQAGVKPIEAKGKQFDPYMHEVLTKEVNDDVEEDTVLEELQKGYMYKERVLRPSRVKVSKRKQEEEKLDKSTTCEPDRGGR